MLVLHGTTPSGHTHRVETLLTILDLPYRLSPSPAEVRATPAFRALNPLGQIPVLEDGDLVIADSAAILVYLVRRYAPDSPWLPEDPVVAARVQQWLSIASGELRFGPALARIITLWDGPGDLAGAHALAARILAFMDQHLATRRFLAAEHATLADLACYAYAARAPEGRIALEPYPQVRAWLARVEDLPRFKPMITTAVRT